MERHKVARPKRQQREAVPEEHAHSDGDMLYFSAVVFFCSLIFHCLSFFFKYSSVVYPVLLCQPLALCLVPLAKWVGTLSQAPPPPFLSMLNAPLPPFFNVGWKRLRSDISTLNLGGRGGFALLVFRQVFIQGGGRFFWPF